MSILNSLFSDNFQRANGPLGSNWTTVPSGDQPFAISSDTAIGSIQADDADMYVSSVSCPNDQWASVVVGTVGTTDLAGVGPMVRASSSANTFYRVIASGGSTTMRLYRAVAGSITQLASSATQVASGDVLTLTVQGNVLNVYKNGSIISALTYTDSSPIASGSFGMSYSSQDSVVDSILGFYGGSFIAAGPTFASDAFAYSGNLNANWTPELVGVIAAAVSGVVEQNASGGDSACLYTGYAGWPNDQWAQLNINTLNTNTTSWAGVLLRDSTSVQNSYRIFAGGPLGATASLTIAKMAAGVYTVLKSIAATLAITSGQTLLATIQGNLISAYVNGSLVLQTTDQANSVTAGIPGLTINANSVLTDAQGAAWSGGGFTAASVAGGSPLTLLGVGA